MYDLIIIGGGPAAIAAGIYTARKRIKAIMLVKEWGGQASKTGLIENYPGFNEISGPELVEKMVSQLKKYEIEIKEGVEVKKIKWVDEQTIQVDDFQSKTLIAAIGGVPRKLNVPGEKEFAGRGVAYCSICDAPLFKNEEVAVVGGGNAGLEAALDLAKYASKIYVLETKERLSGDEFLSERIQKEEKITVITDAAIKEIKGDKFVANLVYQDNQSEKIKELSVQGVFVSVGWAANSSLLENVVELNERREVKINARNQTSKPNIFAAGDLTDVSHKQLIIAAGEGVKAALNVYDYLNKIK